MRNNCVQTHSLLLELNPSTTDFETVKAKLKCYVIKFSLPDKKQAKEFIGKVFSPKLAFHDKEFKYSHLKHLFSNSGKSNLVLHSLPWGLPNLLLLASRCWILRKESKFLLLSENQWNGKNEWMNKQHSKTYLKDSSYYIMFHLPLCVCKSNILIMYPLMTYINNKIKTFPI